MYNISDFIKNRTIRKSVELFSIANISCGVNCEFSSGEFENFIDTTYDLYEYHNRIYQYEEDIDAFIRYTIMKKISNNKRKITIENILDSIWEVKTNDNLTPSSIGFNSAQVTSLAAYKIKKNQERYYDR